MFRVLSFHALQGLRKVYAGYDAYDLILKMNQ